jgi:hypothetical protein
MNLISFATMTRLHAAGLLAQLPPDCVVIVQDLAAEMPRRNPIEEAMASLPLIAEEHLRALSYSAPSHYHNRTDYWGQAKDSRHRPFYAGLPKRTRNKRR